MRKLGLVSITVLVVVVGLARPAAAQPAPPEPPTVVSPDAVPPPPPSPSAPIAPPSSVPVSSPAPWTLGPPSQYEAPPAARPQLQPVTGRRLSETTAALLSLGGTLASWTLLINGAKHDSETAVKIGLLGTLLAPNLGHWYQGTLVTRGTGFRVIGALAMAYGFVQLAFCEEGCNDSDALYFYGGALLYIGATFDDILDAPRRVRKRNRRIEALGLAPMVTGRATGLALGGRF